MGYDWPRSTITLRHKHTEHPLKDNMPEDGLYLGATISATCTAGGGETPFSLGRDEAQDKSSWVTHAACLNMLAQYTHSIHTSRTQKDCISLGIAEVAKYVDDRVHTV
ncbi:unnamed protein product [Discosporangium mesarthrocarpum]